MISRRSVPLFALATAALGSLLAACAHTSGGGGTQALTIRIGVDLPLTGIDAASAGPVRGAIELAVAQANAAGLPGGASVEVEDLDDTVQGKHDPAQGAQNAKTLVADPSVVVMIGPMNSSVAAAQLPVTADAHLAQLTPAATAVELTRGPEAMRARAAAGGTPTFFRLCAADDRGGAALASFAHGLHFDRVFIVDDNESYGKGIADVFERSFTALGGTVAGHEHLTPFQLDFTALITKIAALKPDAVFFGGVVSTGGGVFRKQMGDAGLGRIPYLGGDGLLSPDYGPLAGKAAENTYFAVLSPDVSRLSAAAAFVKQYRAKYGSDPSSYAAAGYAATEVALAAIRRELKAHPGAIPARSAIAADIGSAPPMVTSVGSVSFDGTGELRAPIVSLYRFTGGKPVFVRQIATR